MLMANIRNKVQELLKSQKVATIMPHPTNIIPTAIFAAELLSLLKDTAQDKVEPQFYSRTVEKSFFLKHLDLSHVPKGSWERRIDKIRQHVESSFWRNQHYVASNQHRAWNTAFHTTSVPDKPESQKVRGWKGWSHVQSKHPRICNPLVSFAHSHHAWTRWVLLHVRALQEAQYNHPSRNISPSRMDKSIYSMGEAIAFSTLDTNYWYLQLSVVGEEKNHTSFTSHVESGRFNRMPIRHMYVLATFELALDIISETYISKSCLVNLTDMITFLETLISISKILRTFWQHSTPQSFYSCWRSATGF